MKRGFLLVDRQMNTMVLQLDESSVVQFAMDNRKVLAKAVKHSTRKQLLDDVRAYLNDEYKEDRHES